MKDMIVLGVFLLLMPSATIQAKPVLVAVELDNRVKLEYWVSQSFPTYECINQTAIAEIDESQIPLLVRQGFSYSVIDEMPWSEHYYIGRVPDNIRFQLPGTIIWQKNDVYLVKLPRFQVINLMSLRAQFRPLKKAVLPARFWKQLLTKTVVTRAVNWDPFIQSIVDQVSADSLSSYIQRLQDFRTRLVLSDSSYAASEWLRQKFNSWGYTAEFDSIYLDEGWPGVGYERNVIAQVDGTLIPAREYIIDGHFDSVVWFDTALARYFAPGANDNGSGTAAALEAARIFSNYSWQSTIKFIGWAAEEIGMYGSDHYAHIADSAGKDIGGVVNLDMTGHVDDDSVLDANVEYGYGSGYWLAELFYQCRQLYVPSLVLYYDPNGGGSDWVPFAMRGYSAIGAAERWAVLDPTWHDTTDVLANMNPELFTMITKVGIATLAIVGSYPSQVQDVAVHDMGDGSRLLVTWSANIESNVVGYKVLWGLESEVYTDSHYVAGLMHTIDTLSYLMTDSTYYIIVAAVDDQGRMSPAATEVMGVPRSTPVAPIGIVATPIVSGIRIDWQPNQELDIAGYRVYRRMNDNPVYDSLNTVLLKDTTYTNAPLSGADKYYYRIRAYDLDGNFSVMSDEAYGKPITLDQGILLVDETRNGTNPPDSLQDAFYHAIFEGYTYTDYEFDGLVKQPVFADLAPYSTVVWHADDYNELWASGSVGALRDYLEAGGNLWFMGWQPLKNFMVLQYPMDFSAGDFVHDYLKIAHAEVSSSSDSFQAAIGLLGYPQLDIDSAKVPVSIWHGTLRYIEALTSVAPGEDIYTIDMKNNSSPFEGEVCGVRYLGSDYRLVYFGFPLYFMDEEQARAVALKVMDDFGEVGIAEQPRDKTEIMAVRLYQNSPNPFVSKTLITYEIPHQGFVSLKIYNSVGQLVKTLINEAQTSGVYSISWLGCDDSNRRMSSGVYFCRLDSGNECSIGKMLLVR